MNVIVACSSDINQGSGILSYSKNLCISLTRQGYRVKLISPILVEEGSRSNSWFTRNSIENYEHSLDDSADVYKRLLQEINDFKPDIVINNDNCYIQALFPCINAKKVCVVHLANFVIGRLVTINKNYVDLYVAISSDMKRDLIDKYNINPKKIKVIFNGLVNNLTIKNRQFEKHNNNKIKFIFAGEYTKRKGADLFIKLINHPQVIDDERFEFHWTVGDKKRDLSKSLLSNINRNQLHLYDKLPFSQYQSLMAKCDVFLMPSREEGCPMALLEAMNSGLCPLVSDGKGAMKEIVHNGYNGVVIDLKNWGDEVAKLLGSIDQEQISLLGKNARTTMENGFVNNEFSNEIIVACESLKRDICNPPKRVKLYKWHRVSSKTMSGFARIINSLSFRFGILYKIKLSLDS